MNGCRLQCALIAVLCCLGAAPAWAQTPAELEQAKLAWKSGQDLFQAGRYQEALGHFSRGHALSHKPAFLFNMAECRRLIDNRDRAKALYERFICEVPDSPNVAEAKLRCNELGLGTCRAQCAAAPASRPAEAPVRPAPATSATSGTSAQRPLGDAQLTRDPAPLAPEDALVAQPTSRPEERTPFYKHWGFWTGVGAVVVAGSVTAIVLATRSDGELPRHEYLVDYR